MKEQFSDPYIDKNGVLFNKLGLTDDKLLFQKEADISQIRAAQILSEPLPIEFDFSYLKYIHRCLFSDIYTWAGSIRRCDISKGNSLFCLKDNIESFAEYIFRQVRTDLGEVSKLSRTPKDEISTKLAEYFAEINALHPFREGNGRTQKIFISQLAKLHGLKIEWSMMTKTQLLNASIEAMNSKPTLLSKLFIEHSFTIKPTN